jgi:hypothetical protein
MTRIGAPTMKGEVIQGKTLVSFVRILAEVIALRIVFILTLCYSENSRLVLFGFGGHMGAQRGGPVSAVRTPMYELYTLPRQLRTYQHFRLHHGAAEDAFKLRSLYQCARALRRFHGESASSMFWLRQSTP